MRIIKKLIIKGLSIFIPLCFTEKVIENLESRLGIGSGGGAAKSGETVVFDILRTITDNDLVIFDVGANKGQYASEVISSGFRKFHLHCFEPSKKTFDFLQEKHEKNKNITLNNFGLAEVEGKAILYMNAEGSGLASLTERRLDHFKIKHGELKEKIELQTIDNYCNNKKIRKINLLKIDVEGHELDTLKGAEFILEKKGVDFIQFEFGGCNIDTRTYFQDYYYYLKNELGYKIFRILPSKKLLFISRYKESDEKFRTANYLAVKEDISLKKYTIKSFI